MIKGTNAWVNFLETIELPLLSNTLRSICMITASDSIRIEELVKVILNDADLTSKVLKLANSVNYNPSRTPTTTMSRAIVQIGFDSIKTIAISSALVDQLAKKNNQTQLFHTLVRSFHAAVQAKYMASDFTVEEQEAIFIAALLFDVGEAAFWSCSSGQTTELEERLNCHANQFIDDQKDVLGTSFKAISRGLAKSWHLGPLLEEALTTPASRQARIVCAAVDLAHYHDDKQGMQDILKVIALLTDKTDAQLREELNKNTVKAAILAEQFGIKGARSFLKSQQNRRALKPDSEKQFQALLQISEHIATGKDRDSIINLILESMHSCIGLERCAMFISKPGSSNYKIFKYAGFSGPKWLSKPELYIAPAHPFHAIIQRKETQLLPQGVCHQRPDSTSVEAAPFSICIPAVIGPFVWTGHFQGFIYADRLNQSEIDKGQVSSFRLFMQQLQLVFAMHSK
jgi:HD-like signal output (HDOD) protein